MSWCAASPPPPTAASRTWWPPTLGREIIRRVREEMQATHSALDTLDESESATLYALLERLRPRMEKNA